MFYLTKNEYNKITINKFQTKAFQYNQETGLSLCIRMHKGETANSHYRYRKRRKELLEKS